ncbi:MAG: DNA polymerase/3'-5' exonuclease PolX [Gaiellaceae bacterium]|jgi:DNA polymerase (family 10)
MTARAPSNAEVAAQFELLADLIELEGGDSFRINAYRRAAKQILDSSRPVTELALAGRSTDLPGIGKTIEGKIREIAQDGKIHALAEREQRVPAGVVSFLRLPGIGPRTAARFWLELGLTTPEELRQAAEDERLRTLPGLGSTIEAKVLKALERAGEPEEQRVLLGQALPAAFEVLEQLARLAGVVQVSEAGSLRRRLETVHDIDLIATSTEPAALIARFTALDWVAEVAAAGATKAEVIGQNGLHFDLRVVAPQAYGNVLQHFTGSKQHNIELRENAVKQGLSVSEYGVTRIDTGEIVSARSEEELYEFLGYTYIPPELREGSGELEAARSGLLPRLIELSDLRGDLHVHSNWSDGRAPIEEMARAAIERGYEYIAITDHGDRLREGRLDAQLEEIEALNRRLAPFRILSGVESAVRADGSLDLPDEQLARLDWVIAALHTSFERNPTERILGAMENPQVDCIAHPTARKIGERQPPVVVERLIEKAVETGTALEMNGQPDRLDLRDAHARAAGEAGAKIVISSDGHRPVTLMSIELALAQARRAWLTSEQVLNTRSWAQILRARKSC